MLLCARVGLETLLPGSHRSRKPSQSGVYPDFDDLGSEFAAIGVRRPQERGAAAGGQRHVSEAMSAREFSRPRVRLGPSEAPKGGGKSIPPPFDHLVRGGTVKRMVRFVLCCSAV